MHYNPYQQQSTNQKEFYCVTDFNPSSPNIPRIISDNWSYLDRSSSTRSLVPIPTIFGHRKPKNILEIVSRSDIRIQQHVKKFPPKCHKPLNCQHCSKLNKTGKIISTSTGRSYSIPKHITCNSTNVIYCIECRTCKLQYVGQTKNKLLTRINQHLSDIRTTKDTPIARHFNTHEVAYTLHVLHLVSSDDVMECNKFENY